MGKYVFKKVLLGLMTIFFSFVMTFFLIRLAPGTPMMVIANKENPNPEQIEYLKEKYNLDKPVAVQFTTYVKNAAKGDFGFSYKSNLPVFEVIKRRIGPTLLLTLMATFISIGLGILFGIIASRNLNGFVDKLFNHISYFFDAMPSFWLGLILIYVFAGRLRWFPTSGLYNLRESYTGFKKFLDLMHHMALPILTIVLIQTPIFYRIVRSSIANVMNQNFIKTGIFAKETSKIIKSASIMKEQSDYLDFFIASKQDAEEQIERAKQFIEAVEKYLKDKKVL